MDNKNVLLEINEIKSKMGLLTESPIPTSLLSNLFKRVVSGNVDDIFKKYFPRVTNIADESKVKNIINKIKSGSDNIGNTLKNLPADELSLILRSLNPTKAAKLMFDEGLLFKNEVIEKLVESDIEKILKQGKSIEDIIAIYRDNIPTVFGLYKKGTITDKGVLEILNEYVTLYEKRLKSKLPKSSVFLETLFKNTITYKRMIINSFKKKANLSKEIDEILNELESAIIVGDNKRITTLTKKWTDYVSSILPKYNASVRQIANDVYIKNLPKNVKARISAEDFYNEFRRRVDLSGTELKDALKNPFLKINPFEFKSGNFKINLIRPTKELYKRMGAIIARNSLSKMEDVILLLMNKGLVRYLSRRALTTLLMTGAIVPLVYGTTKSLYKLFPGVERDDKSWLDEVTSAIKNSLDKINFKDFTNIDDITPYVIDGLIKIWDIMTKPSLEYISFEEELERVENELEGINDYGQILKNAKDIYGDSVDMIKTQKVREQLRDLGYGDESQRAYYIDKKQMYVTNKGETLEDYHILYKEGGTGRLNYVVNNKKQYLKKDSELDTNDSQTTTTNESPEQRWISEHSNGSFKKLNPNKPTTWLYYTEPNNQGDRYIYKDNQFIQK
jgi:uncharacterized membrane-anchored protein